MKRKITSLIAALLVVTLPSFAAGPRYDEDTDFDYVPLQLPAPEGERRHGRYRVKSCGFGVRIAQGGPEFAFATLNGDIYIRNQDRKRR